MCQATRLRLAAFLAASLALEGIVLRRNGFNSAHDGLVVMVIRLGVAALVWIERILSGGLATKTFLLAGSAIGTFDMMTGLLPLTRRSSSIHDF